MRLETKALYEFGKFRFDPANRLLMSDGAAVPLTPKAFDVLLVLVQNGSRLTTKEELMSKVWPDSFVEEANLTVNVSALRKILGVAPDGRQYIETVPKKGYRFVAVVKEIKEAEEPPFVAEAAKNRDQGKPAAHEATDGVPGPLVAAGPQIEGPKDRSWARWVVGGVSVLLIVLLATYFFLRGPQGRRFGLRQSQRLAVLPFQNLRENAESDFLGFSLADAVITKLGYVSELSVRPSYAVQKYKAKPVDIRGAARDLNVDTLLTGTYLREGDDLRVACQLIDAKAETILWKGTFDLKYDKLLTLQDQVAAQIINGLELTLSPTEARHLKADASISPLAYEYYLRGVDLYAMSDFPMAIRMLEESTELAPNYSLAWANLGKAYTANASFQLAGAEQYQKAQMAFERALALQPDQIDAGIYMANMFTDTGRVERAVPLLRKALHTNPNHAEVHWELGYAYRFAGMLEESVLESETARRLDPGVKLNSSTFNGYLYLNQYDKFLESLPRSDDQPLIVFYRGFGEYYEKNWDAAANDFDRAYDLDPALLQAQIGKALAFAVRRRESQGLAILRNVEVRITQRAVGDPEASYKIAQAYTAMGDASSALRVLKRSIDGGFFPSPYFNTDPLLDPLRKEPEFARLLDAAGERHAAFVKSFF
jgi:DNA-binding winged helix-turn-helix (wHTH) protein/TolB-like protein